MEANSNLAENMIHGLFARVNMETANIIGQVRSYSDQERYYI